VDSYVMVADVVLVLDAVAAQWEGEHDWLKTAI
jgi:hypothetical protein